MSAVCVHVRLFTREAAENFFFYRQEFVDEFKFRLKSYKNKTVSSPSLAGSETINRP